MTDATERLLDALRELDVAAEELTEDDLIDLDPVDYDTLRDSLDQTAENLQKIRHIVAGR